jgi:ubiquitin-activating enzyme E1
MYLDALDVLPDSYLSTRKENSDDYEDMFNRYDGQRRIFGSLPIADQRVFVVGSGAVGCEHIKNLTMMGVGTSDLGKVIVTDMDSIELSNLNRQFLFRSDDIGEPKSEVAVKKAKTMNPLMNIEAHTRRVGKETEDVYDSTFMKNQTIVMNALDNVQARKYMDGRCVNSHTPLLECGTLGTIGSVQVVYPNVTESYSSFEDADQKDAIPVCTLKLFPSTFEHVVEYARSSFESYFSAPQATYLKLSNDLESLDQMGPTDLLTTHKEVLTLIENCKNFKYCIRRAFNVFHQMFRDPVSQLIRKYPEDHKTEDGDTFWSGSKIFPTVIYFDIENETHVDFIIRFSHVWADSLGIPQSKRYPVNHVGRFKKFIQTLKVPDEVKNEDVDLDEDKDKDNSEDNEEKTEPEVDDNLLRQQIKMMVQKAAPLLTNIAPAEFEKDDDSNNHVDFMTDVSNLRAENYHIPTKDRLHVKGVAGKIIPAIATTTSIVSGLMSLEFCKIVYASTLPKSEGYATCSRFRYGTFNLGSATFAFGDSIPPKVQKVGKKEYTIWSTDSFDAEEQLEDVIDHYCDLGAGAEDSDSESDVDSESGADSNSESLIENPLTVHSVYLDDELVYNEFNSDIDSKTLEDVIRESREPNEDATSRDYMFQVTMAPEDIADDLDAVQESSINIKFRVHL